MTDFMRSNACLALGICGATLALSAAGCMADSAPAADDEVTAEAAQAITIDPMRSLILTGVNDATALGRFSLKRVLQQIINRTPGVTALTPTQLYQQMFDTMNSADHAQTTGPHCTGTLNGFATECPRTEGILAATNPFVAPPAGTIDDRYKPTAIVNRFDLAPTNGADCGEYRIVYAKATSGFGDRNFLIFEGRLPNPSPTLGLQGCHPVAQMWADLTGTIDPVARANALESFYFTGLTSGGVTFEPVVDPTHYGMTAAFTPGGSVRGQIRVNMFMPFGRTYFAGGTQPPASQFWQLRELQTRKICVAGGACSLQIRQTTSKNNPDASLFAPSPAAGSKAESFQTTDFLAMVPKLARPAAGSIDAALIGMKTPDKYNSGESSSDGRQDYLAAAAGNTVFKSAIQARLNAMGRSDLTATAILRRASSQSCGGCHQVSNGVSMGAGITFPNSNGFTQIDESGTLSPALTDVFLPHRKAVLEGFVNAPAAAVAAATAEDDETIGGDGMN
jgi:hypothetical protein